MKAPSQWTKADLHHHLQHAIDLEFWTIPLYLTALYSIKGLRTLEKKDYPEAAKLIQSVVIQEMLHLELVCNISNALGYSPRFHAPQYDETKNIPFIHPNKEILPNHLHGYLPQLGPLDRNTLKLFCAIELPHTKKEIEWEKQHSCCSIAELYIALEEGIKYLWNECYVGDNHNTKQKTSFHEYHNREGRSHGFSQAVTSPETALKAIEAIIEQGEGADSRKVPADFRPPAIEEGKTYDPGWFKGHLSHYQKFSMLLHHHHQLPEVYSADNHDKQSAEQTALNSAFSGFMEELNASFRSEGTEMTKAFWNKMFGIANALMAVWEKGNTPQFNYNPTTVMDERIPS